MASSPISNRVKDEIVALRRNSVQIDAEKLLGIVRAVVDSMGNDLDCASLKVYAEIEDLAACIRAAREDISALCPSEITEKHLPTASDELDAIVESTERATNSIMEAAESIEALAADLPEPLAERVTTHITTVYEACGFQDITGQRINKVVKTLKHIEARIEDLLVAFGKDAARGEKSAVVDHDRQPGQAAGARPDEHLMNGPQLEGEGISQADIDALLAVD